MSDRADIELRVLGPADFEQVLRAERIVFAEDPWTPGMIGEELTSTLRHYVGAFEQGTFVGWAGLSLGVDGDVMTIGVLPDFRGRGVGHLLLAELLRVARQASVERVFLEVRASNTQAISLYERQGFVHIGRIKHYFRNPSEDAVTMRVDLSR